MDACSFTRTEILGYYHAQRPYLPINCPLARIWPFIARSSSCLVARGIGIIADERETLRCTGSAAPPQWGRTIFAIARVHLWNRGTFLKRRACQFHTRYSQIVRAASAARQEQQ